MRTLLFVCPKQTWQSVQKLMVFALWSSGHKVQDNEKTQESSEKLEGCLLLPGKDEIRRAMPAWPQNALANSNEHDQVPLTQGAYSPLAVPSWPSTEGQESFQLVIRRGVCKSQAQSTAPRDSQAQKFVQKGTKIRRNKRWKREREAHNCVQISINSLNCGSHA